MLESPGMSGMCLQCRSLLPVGHEGGLCDVCAGAPPRREPPRRLPPPPPQARPIVAPVRSVGRASDAEMQAPPGAKRCRRCREVIDGWLARCPSCGKAQPRAVSPPEEGEMGAAGRYLQRKSGAVFFATGLRAGGLILAIGLPLLYVADDFPGGRTVPFGIVSVGLLCVLGDIWYRLRQRRAREAFADRQAARAARRTGRVHTERNRR